MANDRLFIRCRYCGECFCFAKYYPGNLHFLTEQGTGLLAWLSTHINERVECEWKVYDVDLEGEPGFEFVTEDPQTSTGMMYYPNGGLFGGEPVHIPQAHFKPTQKVIDNAVT